MPSEMCSSAPSGALNLFWGVLKWKKVAEEALEASNMSYLIVRPGQCNRLLQRPCTYHAPQAAAASGADQGYSSGQTKGRTAPPSQGSNLQSPISFACSACAVIDCRMGHGLGSNQSSFPTLCCALSPLEGLPPDNLYSLPPSCSVWLLFGSGPASCKPLPGI